MAKISIIPILGTSLILNFAINTSLKGQEISNISFAKGWELTNLSQQEKGIGPVMLGPDGKPKEAPKPIITPYSLEEAAQLLISNSQTIEIANKATQIARAEKQKLNSAWYPYITASGSYIHMNNNISVKANAGEAFKPVEDVIGKYMPNSEQIAALLKEAGPVFEQLFPHLTPQQIEGIIGGIGNVIEGIGSSVNNMITEMNSLDLTFPILKNNVATIDATATWPLFTGGKRIFANRIGKSMIASSEGLKTITTDAQLVVMIEAYYTYKLTLEIEKEKEENYKTMELLNNNAMSLMSNGMINKAEMLVAEVAFREAIRELENCRENKYVTEEALKTVIGIQYDQNIGNINPISDFFIINHIPPIEYFKAQIDSNNTQLKVLNEQRNITKYEKKIAESNYAPNIALFAKQNIYSYQIPSNLAPRTIFGAGMVWNLFDGLNREKNISIAKKNREQIDLTIEQTKKDLYLLATKLRSQMNDAINNLNTLKATIELCEELLSVREKSFKEGMATSFDVVEARNNLTKARIATSFAHWQYDVALANMSALCGDINLASYFWFANNSKLVNN